MKFLSRAQNGICVQLIMLMRFFFFLEIGRLNMVGKDEMEVRRVVVDFVEGI